MEVTLKNILRNLFVVALIAGLCACGKNESLELSDETMQQMQVLSGELTRKLNQMPRTTQAVQNQGDLGMVVAYAYPNAQSVGLPTAEPSARGAAYTGSVNWYRQGNTYVNNSGQSLYIGGGSIYDSYGNLARGGYFYNSSTGNRAYGGLVYVPGYGLGVGIHACSPSTQQCGTAVAGLGNNKGGYAYCVNGQCQGNRWY